MSKVIPIEVSDEVYASIQKLTSSDPEGMRLLFIRALARDELIQRILPKQFFYFYDNDYHPVDFSFNADKYRKVPKR